MSPGRVAAGAWLAPSPGGGCRAGLPQGWGQAMCVARLFHVCRDTCSCLQARLFRVCRDTSSYLQCRRDP